METHVVPVSRSGRSQWMIAACATSSIICMPVMTDGASKTQASTGRAIVTAAVIQLPWSASHRLRWSDFKGSPGTSSGGTTPAWPDFDASTASGYNEGTHFEARWFDTPAPIKVTVTVTAVQVRASFYPARSWVQPSILQETQGSTQDRARAAFLLGHEQGHFDITEFYAQRIEKRLRHDVVGRSFVAEGATIQDGERAAEGLGQAWVHRDIATLDADWRAFERGYDTVTCHGRDRRRQVAWLRRIATMVRTGRTQTLETTPGRC